MQYHPVGRDNGYVLTIGGKRFYIAGDTEGVPEMLALEAIDVAFVPMNLPYTMSVEEAAPAVAAFAPAFVYPYHYRAATSTPSPASSPKAARPPRSCARNGTRAEAIVGWVDHPPLHIRSDLIVSGRAGEAAASPARWPGPSHPGRGAP